MRRHPRNLQEKAILNKTPWSTRAGAIGLVLSGGGSRAAYQIGALKALIPYLQDQEHNPIKVVIGSSLGAINGLLISACLKEGIAHAVEVTEELWKERTFRNTFADSPSASFFRAIKVAAIQSLNPGPNSNTESIFNPRPLMERVDQVINDHGGLHPNNRLSQLESVGVMTTIEGETRRPLLFVSSHKELESPAMLGASFDVCYVDSLQAKHGFASAALPSVLPPVELDTKEGTVRLVDGGISQNVPVDPAVRMGAERIISIDISGRDWWLNRQNSSLDTRPSWEVEAQEKTFCLRPPETFVIRCRKPLGELLKNSVNTSSRKFIGAVGPIWPIFKILKNRLGEEVAYETLSYVALDPDYIQGLIERGYNETVHLLNNREEPEFHHPQSYKQLLEEVFSDN